MNGSKLLTWRYVNAEFALTSAFVGKRPFWMFLISSSSDFFSSDMALANGTTIKKSRRAFSLCGHRASIFYVLK
jgi:hypothetical protein